MGSVALPEQDNNSNINSDKHFFYRAAPHVACKRHKQPLRTIARSVSQTCSDNELYSPHYVPLHSNISTNKIQSTTTIRVSNDQHFYCHLCSSVSQTNSDDRPITF